LPLVARNSLERLVADFIGEDVFFTLVQVTGVGILVLSIPEIHGLAPFERTAKLDIAPSPNYAKQ
jgi:hypothetical protein